MVGGFLRGADVLRQIQTTHAALGRDVQSTRQRQDQRERAARQRLRERGQALLELAKHYLPDMSSESVSQTFAEVRDELERLLDQQRRREADLRQQWEHALDRRAELESSLDETTSQLNELVAQREQLEQLLASKLEANQEFHDLSDQAVAAETELARNEARVAESRQEASVKLPAYKRSRLFQYLVERGYGTPGYKHRGMTRRWDKWVARLIDFHKQKQSYDFLRVTPELMGAEVDRRRTEFDGLMEQVESIERQVSDEIGLTACLEQGVEVGNRRDALLSNLDATHRERDRFEQEIAQLTSNQGQFYSQAITRVKRFLESVQSSSLEAHARQTADREDDALAAEARRLEEEIEQTKSEASKLQDSVLFGQRRLAELSDLSRQFRAHEYDSQRSVFEAGYDARPVLDAFLQGRATKQEVWRSLRGAQRFAPQWVEERWDRPGGVLDNDFSYVLMRVLAEAAGAMIEQSARGGSWQTRSGGVGGPPAPRRRSRSARPPSVRRRAKGGFTTGRGF